MKSSTAYAYGECLSGAIETTSVSTGCRTMAASLAADVAPHTDKDTGRRSNSLKQALDCWEQFKAQQIQQYGREECSSILE